jgi:hypothetical protein
VAGLAPPQAAPILVLDVDPDLGSGIGPEEWEAARHACRGELVRVRRGRWDLPAGAGERDDLIGLLIVAGLLCREVAVRDRHMLELLGPGDVLPLPAGADRPRLGSEIVLTAANQVELVAIGRSFALAGARWPCLLAAMNRRIEAQREQLALQGLIAHLPRADHRVLLILWHLADRWGRVSGQGTVLPLTLTHDLLAQLAAARRSTITIALGELETDGFVRRLEDGSWLLTPLAEGRVDAVTGAGRRTRSAGDILAVRSQINDTREDARALRAEAQALRHQRPR